MSFDNYLKRIDHRDWNNIRGKWLSHIPNYSYAGEAPTHQINEFIGIDQLYKGAKESHEGLKTDVPKLREEVLREGIYFIHKAVHICGAAIIHLDNGILTWGISSAYQSSFFAVKGILDLLGLSFPLVGMKNLMIDCFPEEEKLSKGQAKKYGTRSDLKFIVFDALSHKHHWQIFQRVLRTSSIQTMEEGTINFLRNLDPDAFAKQRNSIHYRSNYWVFQKDIFERIFEENFAVNSNLLDEINYSKIDSDVSDFSFFVCYILLKTAIELIKDLGILSSSIGEEYEKILFTLNEGIHARFLSSVPITG